MPNLELSRVSKVRRSGAHFLGGAYINFEVNIRVLPLGRLAPALIHPSDCRGHMFILQLNYGSSSGSAGTLLPAFARLLFRSFGQFLLDSLSCRLRLFGF